MNDQCPKCGAPCATTVNMRGGDHGWGTTDAERTVYRYAPSPASPDAGVGAPSVGTASMYAQQHGLAVTTEWMIGWNACLDAIDAAPASAPEPAFSVSWKWLRGVINALPGTPSGCYEMIARHDVLAWIDEGERRGMLAASREAPEQQGEAVQAAARRLLDGLAKATVSDHGFHDDVSTVIRAALAQAAPATGKVGAVVDMVLHCPKCGMQHIDGVEELPMAVPGSAAEGSAGWVNPPHRSHLCRPEDGGCGHIWRPADVPTNGVQAVKTTGKADSPIATPAPTVLAEMGEALTDLRAAVAFLDQMREAAKNGEEVGSTGIARDARQWLERAARAALKAAQPDQGGAV